MITVKDISEYINEIAPYKTKCEWDNCGILVGNPEAQVVNIGFCLDLTGETIANAKSNNVDLIVTHHPAIFKAKKSFLDGEAIFEAAKSGISVISAHTCFDCADGGVNDVLCDILNLSEIKKVPSDECEKPMVRIGVLEKEMTSQEFAHFAAKKLCTTVRFVDCKNNVKTVAVCGGAGMSFLHDVAGFGADAYLTGDISHHEMLEAKDCGVTVVAAGHFETEYPAMDALKKRLAERFDDINCILLKQSNPIEFIS